jgi:acetyl-CoA acyltransferase
MINAVIVDAVRTPIGRRNGKLSGMHPVPLAAHSLRALVERNGFDPNLIDDVIMGCVTQVGEQSVNVARNATLVAGLPEDTVATTIDRQCGSSQQAVHFAAQGVMAGVYDVVIAAGIESMSRVPMGSSMLPGTNPFSDAMRDRYPQLVPQGISAEMIASRWNISREDNDAFALASHQRAARAIAEGRFDNEIVPIMVGDERMTTDEGVRPDSTLEKLSTLKPAFQEDGVITAGNSSQISDASAAVLIMSEAKAAELGLRPRARFVGFALAGVDPVIMLTGPIPATTKVLERTKMSLEDMDAIEINEAFAPVVLAWEREHRPDMSKVNINGGAIALGHPLGASGARLTATLLNELERSGGRYGLQTMCEGGGMANAMIIERLG